MAGSSEAEASQLLWSSAAHSSPSKFQGHLMHFPPSASSCSSLPPAGRKPQSPHPMLPSQQVNPQYSNCHSQPLQTLTPPNHKSPQPLHHENPTFIPSSPFCSSTSHLLEQVPPHPIPPTNPTAHPQDWQWQAARRMEHSPEGAPASHRHLRSLSLPRGCSNPHPGDPQEDVLPIGAFRRARAKPRGGGRDPGGGPTSRPWSRE